jgi:hypothetical protein
MTLSYHRFMNIEQYKSEHEILGLSLDISQSSLKDPYIGVCRGDRRFEENGLLRCVSDLSDNCALSIQKS